MKIFIFLFFATLPYLTSGRNYFVATTGNNSNPGTLSEPFLTIQHGIDQLVAGDTLYLRGGIYYITETIAVTANYPWNHSNGTEAKPIVVSAYPADHASGNVPIIDGRNAYRATNMWIRDISWWKFWGITTRNAWQDGEAVPRKGFLATRAAHIYFEQCVAHSNSGYGFDTEGVGAIAYFINCDSYNNVDTLYNEPNSPGGRGGGLGITGPYLETDTSLWAEAYFIGCRAWNVSDNSFGTAFGIKKAVFDSCWSISPGRLEGDGRGFAIGLLLENRPTPNQYVVKNCISAYSRAAGYNINSNVKPYQISIEFYNNFEISSGSNIGFRGFEAADETDAVIKFHNNVAYGHDTKIGWLANAEFEMGYPGWTNYTTAFNSWDDPELTITADDFVGPMDSASIVNAMIAPRKADGSLPDLPNLQLSSTSQLIDAGTDVGLPYNGTAPDLGPFQAGHSIIITSPGNGSVLIAPTDILINTKVSGDVLKVEFYAGEIKIGESNSTPWSFNWNNVPNGDHLLNAIAYDNVNAKSKSQIVTIKVIPNTAKIDPNPNDGNFKLVLLKPLERASNISIISPEGKLVFSGIIQAEENSKSFDLSHVETGLHTIVFSDENLNLLPKKHFLIY